MNNQFFRITLTLFDQLLISISWGLSSCFEEFALMIDVKPDPLYP